MIGLASYCALIALLAIGTLSRPAVGFAAVLCLYGLKQWGQTTTSYFTQHSALTNLIIGSLVLVGLAGRVMRGRCLFCNIPPVAFLVLALYAYAFLSLTWTPDLDIAREQWQLQLPYVVTVAALGPLLIGTTRDVRVFAYWTIGIGTALLALVMIYGNWGSRGLIVAGDVYQTEANPLALASLAGTVLVFGALSMQRDQPLLWRALLLAVVPLGVAVIFRSGSRGQLGSAIIAVIAVWPLAYLQKNIGARLLWIVGAAMLVAGAWYGSTLVEANAYRWTAEAQNGLLEGRLDAGMAVVIKAAATPFTFLFGVGNCGAFHYIGFYPHVAALETLGEEGLVGGALYVGIILFTLRSVVRLWLTPALMKNTAHRAALAVLTAGFLFELLLTQKQGSLLSSVYPFAYAILLGRLELLARKRPVTRPSVAASVEAPAVMADSSTLAH